MTLIQGDTTPLPALAWPRRILALLALAALAACVQTPPPMLMSADDRVAVSQIAGYLNGLQSFQAHFTQDGPDGVSEGFVYLSRPGRLLVQYAKPHAKVMIANNGRLKLADQVTGATTSLPVSRTPLDIILAPTISLTGDVTITSLQRLADGLQISLVKTASPGQGTLTLRFAATPLALQGVTILDRNGQTTEFDLQGLQRDVTIAPSRFEFHPPAAS